MAVARLATEALRRGGISESTRKALLTAPLALPVKLYLLSVVIPMWFYLGPLAMNLNRLFLVVMIIPLLFGLLSGKCGKLILTDLMFVLFLAWMALALHFNSPSQMITQMGSMGVEFIGGYLMGRTYIRSPQSFAALSRWVVILTLLTAPLALFETITGDPIMIQLIRSLPGIFSVPENPYPPRAGFWRVQTVFAHPIHYGLFCTIGFSLLLVGMRKIVADKWRRIGAAIICACGLSSLSSGALLANVMQFGLVAWETLFVNYKRRWFGMLGLIALFYVAVDLASNRTPLQVFLSYATFSAHNAYYRILIFDWGMVNVWANPMYGIGMNDWVRAAYMHSSTMDNFWLLIAVRYGIPAFAFLAIGYVWVIGRVILRNFENDEVVRNFRLAWVFTFLGLSFTLCTVHIWHSLFSFVFFMFAAGVWIMDYKPEESDGEVEAEAERSPARLYSRGPSLNPVLTREVLPEAAVATAREAPFSRPVEQLPFSRPVPGSMRRERPVQQSGPRSELPHTRFPGGR